ncbi:MAG: ribonuclease R [Chthoniobacterales bacterium]|nr:ribonuclease R [Chthoniobacterales bacterium]
MAAPEDGLSLEERVSELLHEALAASEIANLLGLGWEERKGLRNLLEKMEGEGVVVKVRGGKYVLAEDADLVVGRIQFFSSGGGRVEGGKRGEVFIRAEDTGTALPGDVVVVRVFPGSRGMGGRLEGRVIRVKERRRMEVVGTLQRTERFWYVVADEPGFVHNVCVLEPGAGSVLARPGDRVVAKVEAWPNRHVNPEGRIVEVLGRGGDADVELRALIRRYGLAGDFPEEVEEEARRVAEEGVAARKEKRMDCREDFVFTIDPEDARDFDDAICVEREGDGWRVAVHIADVAHYVRPRSALDREAQRRGNSVYLPQRVIPMLPVALSNGICSLRPGEDRFAFSVFAKVDRSGKVLEVKFAKTLIRSRERLTYREAKELLEGKEQTEIGRRLRIAWEVAAVLRRKRMKEGALDLDIPEVKVYFGEDGKPERIERVENDISHQLIEELMLLANEEVAKFLRRRNQAVIYRVHEAPDEEKLKEFREVLLDYGVKCGDLSHRREMCRLLERLRGHPHEDLLKVGLLRSLKRACYSEKPVGHYGLAKGDYLHFTSPIRRYADLVAHRALERQLGFVRSGPDARGLAKLAEHLSETERVAAEAEREALKRAKIEFFRHELERRTGRVFRTRVIEVRNYGLVVELVEELQMGLVHVSEIEGDFFVYDRAKGELIGRRSRRRFFVGQELDVVVSRVDFYKQQVDFVPVGKEDGNRKRKKKG